MSTQVLWPLSNSTRRETNPESRGGIAIGEEPREPLSLIAQGQGKRFSLGFRGKGPLGWKTQGKLKWERLMYLGSGSYVS